MAADATQEVPIPKEIMKFSALPPGTQFRFSSAGLPIQLAIAEGRGPFRKVADDEAVEVTDPRGVKLYVPPGTNVVPEGEHDPEAAPPLPSKKNGR